MPTIIWIAITAALGGSTIYLLIRASKERAKLGAELERVLGSVQMFVWQATVTETEGKFRWEYRISDERAASRILPVKAWQGHTWADAWQESKLPEDRTRYQQTSTNAFKTGLRGYRTEYRCKLPNGDLRWFFEDVTIEGDGHGKFELMGSCVEMTGLKQAEETAKSERILLQTVVDSLPDEVFVKDTKCRFLLDNKAHLERLGVSSQAELTGKTDFDFMPERLARPLYVDERDLILGNKKIINQTEYSEDRFGNPRWNWTTKVALIDEQGEVYGLVGINRDITARKKEEEELEKARDEALASTRAKSEFLANMSHEIRTPMNGILGITDMLQRTNLSDEQFDLASTVRTSAEALLTVINDILDLSRIEAGKMSIEITDFDLRALIEEVTDLVAGNAFGRGLEVICLFESDVPARLQGDPVRIRQVLTNLMGNAVKFTEAGEISLEAVLLGRTETDASIRLSVNDTGIGISEEAQARIFESFTQGDGTTSRKYGGTGLGLTISRQLVDLIGGKIAVASQVGKGSRFTIDLTMPIAQGAEPDKPAAAQSELAGARILVVDDNATSRRALHEHLCWSGCEPVETSSAAEALGALEAAVRSEKPFQVAIIDMQMPDIDGEQLGAKIRAESRFDGMRMILLTTLAGHANSEQLRKVGFGAVLNKPVRRAQLAEALRFVQENKQYEPKRQTTEGEDEVEPLGMHVLLAEDNEINQMVATSLLARFGCTVQVVENGRLALDTLAREPFDVVLMDIHMPDMDGYMATTAIRRAEIGQRRRLPVIAMTAKAMAGDREHCLEVGMDDYIMKPVRPEELYGALRRYRRNKTERRKSAI